MTKYIQDSSREAARYATLAAIRTRRKQRHSPEERSSIPSNSTAWQQSPVTTVEEAISISDQISALAAEWDPNNQ